MDTLLAAGCVPTVHLVKVSPDAAGPDRTSKLTAFRRPAELPPTVGACTAFLRPATAIEATHEIRQRMIAPRLVMRVLGAVQRREQNGATSERGADEQERDAKRCQGRDR